MEVNYFKVLVLFCQYILICSSGYFLRASNEYFNIIKTDERTKKKKKKKKKKKEINKTTQNKIPTYLPI